MISKGIKYYVIIICLLLATSCGSSRKFVGEGVTFSYRCPSIVSYAQPKILASGDVKSDPLLSAKYSYTNLEIANAFGLIEDLRVYETLRKKIRAEGKVDPETFDEFANSYNKINEGMNLAALEINSLQDMLNCNLLKLRKIKMQVATSNRKTENNLSNWAIGVGSVTTIITAGILVSQDSELIGSTAFDWLAVAGGVATGILAFQSSRVNKKIRLNPEDNFINSIWTGKNDAGLYPKSTWYLMNLITDFENEQTNIREMIIDEWNDSEAMLANEDNKLALPVLLADEGIYTEEMVDLRIEMLEAVGLGIDLINRELYFFNAKRY
jgi:hypothetical protein